MEEWVRTKAKKMGKKQYKYIDQKIKSNKLVTISHIEKEDAQKKYKQSEGK